MPITRPQFEKILIRQNRAKLAYAKLDVATADGTNADLAAVIAEALRSLKIAVADPTDPTSAELARVAEDQMPQLLAVGHLAALELVLGNRASPDQIADTNNEQRHGQFYKLLEETVARKAAECKARFGYGAEDPAAAPGFPGAVGTLDLGISSTSCWWEC